MTANDYLNLVTSEFKDMPKFTAMISLDVSPLVQVQALLTSMIPIFDVDLAIGAQLDVIGIWVGVSRNVVLPGSYFSWGGVDPGLGWDFGVWAPPGAPANITNLPDDVYRTFIKAKIAANHWDGTTEQLYIIWSTLFPLVVVSIQDNQDMTFTVTFTGTLDTVTKALIDHGYIPLKPEGVAVTYVFA